MPVCKHYKDGLCTTITICNYKTKFKVKAPYTINGFKYDIYGVCEINGDMYKYVNGEKHE